MFTVGVDAERRVDTIATFIQRPRISRWVLTLLGLLIAVTVFGFVLNQTFKQVVREASVDESVLDEALKTGGAGGAVVPAKPGSVIGVLTTSTNRELITEGSDASGFQSGTDGLSALGVAAVQVELFLVDDPTLPVASAATDDQGRFTVANLGGGDYLMLLSGAGYPDVWYVKDAPAADSPADASPITVTLDAVTDLEEIQIGGIPVTIEGKVAGDAAGATLKLVRTGVLDPDVPAVLAEVTIGADGSFTLPDIPSPADLEMIVEKPGFAPVIRKVKLQPGDSLGDITIQLTPAEGKVSGTVNGIDGPLGGVSIVATDGQFQVETVSYTDGDVGAFTLRNLSAPGRYTVTAEADGYVPETQTVTLTAGQPIAQLSPMSLVPSTGQVSGAVTVEGVTSGDVVITLTGGPGIERTTRPISGSGPLAGMFLIDGLPSPASYTLTFASESVLTQVRVVALDPAFGGSAAQLGAVDLRRANRSVRGTVLELGTSTSSGSAVAGAEVVLSDGVTSRKLFSANDPLGSFAFSDVAPGSYTLTATREGAFATVIPVTVEPGTDVVGVDLRLAKQASLVGTVNTGGGACELIVRLFEFDDFDSEPAREVAVVNGTYEFLAVPAPVGYLVAVYTPSSTNPLATTSVSSTPSAEEQVPVMDVSAACRSLGGS